MIKVVVTIILMLLGMAKAISCSVAMPSAYGNSDFECCGEEANYKQALTSDSYSTEQSTSIPYPRASCSALCYHAVTLVNDKVELLLLSDSVSEILIIQYPPSSVHLDSLKRPPWLA
jgi:hypothetical protein